MKSPLAIFFSCLLATPGLVHGQEARARNTDSGEPDRLISQLAGKDRAIPKRKLLEKLLENPAAGLPRVRKAAREGAREERLLALRLLAELKDPLAAEIAGLGLDSADKAIRRRAGSALMIIEDATQLAKVLARLPIEDDTGALKSLIAAAGSSGRKESADSLRRYLRHENSSVRVNTAIALARLGSMEAFGTILEGLESPDTQARREAVYGLGFFSGEERRARAVAQAIINNPTAAWKGEAGISLLRLDLADVPDKLRLLSDASAAGHPRVQAWAIQEIAGLQGPVAEAWLKQRAGRDDALGRFASLRLLLKGGSLDAKK